MALRIDIYEYEREVRGLAQELRDASSPEVTAGVVDRLGAALSEVRGEENIHEVGQLLRLLGWGMVGLDRRESALRFWVQALRGYALLGDRDAYWLIFEDLTRLLAEVAAPYAHAAQFQEDIRVRLRPLLKRWVHLSRPSGDERSPLYVGENEARAYLEGGFLPGDNEQDPQDITAESPEVLVSALLARLRATPSDRPGVVFGRLMERLDLNPCEVWILLILYCAEVDPFLRRLYTYAWNDFSQKEPDKAFLAGLLFGAPKPIWSSVDLALMSHSPLSFYRLVRVQEDPQGLTRVRLTTSGLKLLQSVSGISAELEEWCEVVGGPIREDRGGTPHELDTWLQSWRTKRDDTRLGKLRILMRGASPGERKRVVHWASARAGFETLSADLTAVRYRPYEELVAMFGVLAREARLYDRLIYLEVPTAPQDEVDQNKSASLGPALARGMEFFQGPVLFGLSPHAERYLPKLPSALETEVTVLSSDAQIARWKEALAVLGVRGVKSSDLLSVVQKYPLDASAIEEAASELALRKMLAGGVVGGDILSAAGRKARGAMGGIAQRVSTSLTWNDVVLLDETMVNIQEIVSFARYRSKVMDEWNFRSKLPYGRALSALFWGPPGTGKTMMAGLISAELGMELFRVDLSQIVSKYIGETEKNLGRVFDEAAQNHAIILFDEADSLFSKRTEVKSSVDRYANLEVNFLLQRMEAFEGVTILTTNFESSIDDAFKRRIRFKVHFPLPEAPERAQLWQVMIPEEAEIDDDIDFMRLGREFKLSGGNIKNAIVRAAFIAAERATPIEFQDLWQAGVREIKEMGGLVRDDLDY